MCQLIFRKNKIGFSQNLANDILIATIEIVLNFAEGATKVLPIKAWWMLRFLNAGSRLEEVK